MNLNSNYAASNKGIKMNVRNSEKTTDATRRRQPIKLRAHFKPQRKNTSMINKIFLTAAVITSMACQAKADGFSFGISIGCGVPPPVYVAPPPVFVAPPPPVFIAPPPVVYTPPPVYVAPPPVYLAPPPVIVYPPVYGSPRHGYPHHPPVSRYRGHRR